MSWLKRFFSFFNRRGTSKVKWEVETGMGYGEAMTLARSGGRVRCIEWKKGVDLYFNAGEYYKKGSAGYEVYTPTDSDMYSGCNWQGASE